MFLMAEHVFLTHALKSSTVAACLAGQRIISKHLADNTLLQNYTTVLEILMRMRMICDHADLVTQDAPQSAALASVQAAASHPELVQRLISILKVRVPGRMSIA